MSDHYESTDTEESNPGCFFRMIWFLLGNVALAISFLFLVKLGKNYTIVDGIYWMFVGIMIAARYIDMKTSQKLQNAKEQNKDNPKNVVKYILFLLPISFILWVGGHFIAKLLP